jgi:GDP-4-dehydro-6-deoxy-D-mannose reductase
MKALIIGADGFVGKFLTQELDNRGYNFLGIDKKDVDITRYDDIYNLIYKYRPDWIFHLAAIAFVPTSWQDPNMVFRVNIEGSLNILNAVKSVGIDPIIQIAGSSEEYGLVKPEETPIKETNELRPLSPYGVSKIAMDYLGYQYFKSYGMRIIRTRAFNHEGYGRPESYMPSGFAKQVIEYKLGLKDKILHGNLEAKRDITDVRDMVNAYVLAVEKGEPGEVYNIGSGIAYSAKDILYKLIELGGLDKNEVRLELDKARVRPSDVPLLLCDAGKFIKKTGWKPKYTIDDTLKEELRYWQEQLK